MNWKKLIEDLIEAGFNQSSLSREIGVGQPTISRIVTGEQKDMKWLDGERLIKAHTKHCKIKRPSRAAA